MQEDGNTATDTTAKDYFGYEAPREQPAEDKPQEVKDYQAEVNQLLTETKVTEDGKFVYPENVDPWAKVAIANEKKFRDTQSGFTKVTQELKVAQAELDVLRGKLSSGLTQEQVTELNDIDDKEEYFAKRAEYEAQANDTFSEELEEVRTKTATEIERERREVALTEFNKGRKIPITNELVDNEVPPKFYKQLEAGKITFEQFLADVAKFVDTPKKMANTETEKNVTNLSDVAGGDTPSGEKRYDNIEETYASLVF